MKLSEVNARLKTRDIKGKPYVEVNQRILAFRELYPMGSIETKILQDTGERCDIRCEVYRTPEETRPAATGHAFEFKGAGMVNKTSYVENCETSAIGRALGVLGIGITDSLASADEVAQAIAHQEQGETAPSTERDSREAVRAAGQRLKETVERYAELFGLDAAKMLQDEKAKDTWRPTAAYMLKVAQEYEVKINKGASDVE